IENTRAISYLAPITINDCNIILLHARASKIEYFSCSPLDSWAFFKTPLGAKNLGPGFEGSRDLVQNCGGKQRRCMKIDNAIEEVLREQSLRLAVTYEHATVGIAEIDAEGRRLRVNATACAITGRSR